MTKTKQSAVNSEEIDRAYEILRKAKRSRPVTSEELGHLLGFDDPEGNPRARAVITEVIRQKRLPLGAKGDGYYVLETIEELKDYRADLNRRISGILDRIRRVEEAFENTYHVVVTEGDTDPDEEAP